MLNNAIKSGGRSSI